MTTNQLRDQLREVLDTLDADQLRAALLMVGAFARAQDASTSGGAAGALWWALAEAFAAPIVPWADEAACRQATTDAVAARRTDGTP